jgi:hypothetical protein
MACLLSQQEDFTNQKSMLEKIIHDAGHECIFLLKFHCELNPIEMVYMVSSNILSLYNFIYSTGVGPNIITNKHPKKLLMMQNRWPLRLLMHAPLMLSSSLLTDHGDSSVLIGLA